MDLSVLKPFIPGQPKHFANFLDKALGVQWDFDFTGLLILCYTKVWWCCSRLWYLVLASELFSVFVCDDNISLNLTPLSVPWILIFHSRFCFFVKVCMQGKEKEKFTGLRGLSRTRSSSESWRQRCALRWNKGFIASVQQRQRTAQSSKPKLGLKIPSKSLDLDVPWPESRVHPQSVDVFVNHIFSFFHI